MKNWKVIFTMMTICWTVLLAFNLISPAAAEATTRAGLTSTITSSRCPGRCVNESPNQNQDLVCQQARELEGKIGCNKMRLLGCVYYERTEVLQPGYCLNEGPNQQNDLICKESGQSGGEALCEKFSSFGCQWHPDRLICR